MTSVLDSSTVKPAQQWFAPPGATVGASPQTTPPWPAGTSIEIHPTVEGHRAITTVHFDRHLIMSTIESGRLLALILRLNDLLRQPETSDLYIDTSVVCKVAEAFALVVPWVDTQPSVDALGDGGLALHWERGVDSLDVEFDGEGDSVALIVDRSTDPPLRRAGYLPAMWSNVLRWLFRA